MRLLSTHYVLMFLHTRENLVCQKQCACICGCAQLTLYIAEKELQGSTLFLVSSCIGYYPHSIFVYFLLVITLARALFDQITHEATQNRSNLGTLAVNTYPAYFPSMYNLLSRPDSGECLPPFTLITMYILYTIHYISTYSLYTSLINIIHLRFSSDYH
jgi:hypothetical protein